MEKDTSVSSGSDSAYIDLVVLPAEVPTNPEIIVEEPVNTDLTDSVSIADFGSVGVGGSVQKTYTIRNAGSLDLTGLIVSISGSDAAQISKTDPASTLLTQGQSMTFTVNYAPSAVGSHNANLQIASNDSDENPFDIALIGTFQSPEIVIEHLVSQFGNDAALYGSGGGNLYSIDPSSGATTSIGSIGASISGLSFDPDTGNLYGLDSSTDNLLTIDTSTGAGTIVGALGANLASSGLAYDSVNDVLYAINGGTTLYSINTSTGAASLIGNGANSGIVGLAFDPNAEILYGVSNTTTDRLYTINPANGAQTLVGDLGIDPALSGMAYDSVNDVLFLNDYLGDVLYTVNVGTGEATPVGAASGGTNMQGLAFDPGSGPIVTNLADGVDTLNFQETHLGASSTQPLQIRNTGSLALTGLAASFGGTAATEYSAGAFGSTNLAPGASTTVVMTFTPATNGVRSANLQIASNDLDENPFDLQLSGAGIQPEILVEQPSGSGLADGGSNVEFGNVLPGTSGSLTFVIRNVGNTELSGLSATIDGVDAGRFSAGAFSATTVSPGQSATVVVAFSPLVSGARAAVFHIDSNDADENPFDIALTGLSFDPEIVVEEPTNNGLVDGVSSSRPFGSINLGETSTRTFAIRNTGNLPLTGLSASFTGPAAADFTPSVLGSTTLQPGESTTMVSTFAPSEIGSRVAYLDIFSNDRDENPFDIDVNGVGVIPEIVVEQPSGSGLNDGVSSVDFGNGSVGASTQKTFVIRNTGTGTLRNLSPLIVGANSADFSLGALGLSTLSPGQSTSFVTSFSPLAVGAKNATLQIGSNDADENPFDVELAGLGIAPDISIEIGGVVVNDGGIFEFEDIIGNTPALQLLSLTIRNTGNAQLAGVSSSVDGLNAGEFSLSNPGGATIQPGSSIGTLLRFSPNGFGDKTATLHFASNDPDENPFDIVLIGARLLPTTVGNWADSFGLTGDSRLLTADEDGDHISLLEEYAYNLDPTQNDAQFLTPNSGTSGLPFCRLVGLSMRAAESKNFRLNLFGGAVIRI